jgi:hypothetical protein
VSAKPKQGTGTPAYLAAVRAVRRWLAEAHPDANLIDITSYTPSGFGTSLGCFHADPDNDGPHYGNGTRKDCPYCRGDRLAEGGRP